MKFDSVVLDCGELLKDWRSGLWSIGEEDVADEFTIETLNFVLEYAAELETAEGSIHEFICETLVLYGHFDETKQAAFKGFLEAFCFGFHKLIVESDAYLFGTLLAKFDCFFGDDIVIKKLTKEEIDAVPVLRTVDL